MLETASLYLQKKPTRADILRETLIYSADFLKSRWVA
jgi:hypothetical protein